MPARARPASLVLRTERLLLRPVRVDDAPLLWPWVADHAMTRWLSWDPHKDESVTRAFLREVEKQHADGRGVVWGIFEEGSFRGLVGVEGIQRQVLATRMDQAELGYWLARPFHGRGLMTEAARAAVDAAFATLRLHKIRVRAAAQNQASLRVIRKLGFRRVGTMRSEVFRRGRWLDVERFEMLEDEWTGGGGTRGVRRRAATSRRPRPTGGAPRSSR